MMLLPPERLKNTSLKWQERERLVSPDPFGQQEKQEADLFGIRIAITNDAGKKNLGNPSLQSQDWDSKSS
jgi:hypothetical protein